MAAKANRKSGGEGSPPGAKPPAAAKPPSKKEQILTLFTSGMGEVADIAMLTGARPSYVSSVLHEAGFGTGYFDLYTSTSRPMNAYSKFFAGKLGFKDEAAARESVALIDRLYRQFESVGDRAGQHHAMLMAMTMFNRARWTNKAAEAEVFRRWLADRVGEPVPPAAVEPGKPAPRR